MKLSISNIAWKNCDFYKYTKLVKDQGCSGIELAPSCIWKEPVNADKKEVLELFENIKKIGLKVVGMHSLLYTRPDLQLFKNKNSRDQTIQYIFKLIDICSQLEGKQLIFGSPKNRKLHGQDYKKCEEQALNDFYEISEYSKKKDIFFCIEPLGPEDTDFISSVEEGGKMVINVNHPNFKLHLDTKAIFSTKENPNIVVKKYKDIIQHVHVGDLLLLEPGTVNKNHSLVGEALKNIKYSNYISIEMKKNPKDVEGSILRSIRYVKENYLNI
jgi:D-psicose/D-tagatose/L-ribulose 3-epimerase